MAKEKKWIQKAIRPENRGALREKAKRQGLVKGDQPLSRVALDTLAETGDTTTRRQVALARTLKKLKK